jgi:hypothetical protein
MEIFMKTIATALLSIALLISPALAQLDFIVVGGMHQPAAKNVEKANIIAIRCADGKKYFIYSYFRRSGPNYRAIEPPKWGNPIGGMDYTSFEDAVHAACYT